MHGDCQLCGKRPATVHLIEAQPGGGRAEAHLCPACIEQRGWDLAHRPPAVAAILAKPEAPAAAAAPAAPGRRRRCPACGFALADYAGDNRFGCPACVDAFGDAVAALLRRYHEAAAHVGRRPGPAAQPAEGRTRRQRRAELAARLRAAVAAERFEAAAALRDQLRRLDEEPA